MMPLISILYLGNKDKNSVINDPINVTAPQTSKIQIQNPLKRVSFYSAWIVDIQHAPYRPKST